MKNYLSFGGGVNSVAMYLYLKKRKIEFEAIFVDHGTDYPHTYDYVDAFKKKYPLTILKPEQGNLYEHFYQKKMLPSMRMRYECTGRFKTIPIQKYVETPCFMFIGIDYGERHRARIAYKKGIENRFPLIEAEIDREGCKEIIRNEGLSIPRKSGCYICPFQKKIQFKKLRREYPSLFCKVKRLEDLVIEERKRYNTKKFTLKRGVSISNLVEEKQLRLFKEDNFPPCYCDT